MEQKSDLEKASILARKLVLAEEELNRSRVEGHYRPEEYQIASERLNQLKSLMPTQRMVVRVPFTDNQNDARIFCHRMARNSALRHLQGWHGKPPEEGDETTLFLEGKNFSIHDTHVIAGGKPATSVLVSRPICSRSRFPETPPPRQARMERHWLTSTSRRPTEHRITF